MVSKTLSEQHLKAICDVLADTNKGLTKTEITNILINLELIKIYIRLFQLTIVTNICLIKYSIWIKVLLATF
ncbi:MAG: hypothetical protein E6778_17735 [Niallia nealsonii]|nr:hypothetical protein [Niallia nealsonii]